MEIEKVIKQARLNKKITQEQLVEALSVTTQTVSKWETDSSYLDITLINSNIEYITFNSRNELGQTKTFEITI